MSPAQIGRAALSISLAASLAFALSAKAADEGGPTQMSPEAKPAPHRTEAFGPDPSYADKPYNIDDQLKIYGGKYSIQNPRPMLELGRPMYHGGPISGGGSGAGALNPADHQFLVYGDWRTAFARNVNGGAANKSVLATRLNLDVDWKLTATERVHAFFRPLDRNGSFTRCEFQQNRTRRCFDELDLKAETFFFEGDLGAIVSGGRDRYTSWDLPFAVGKMPLLFQNGIWLEDALTGVAASIPARHSAALGISNLDVTFFAGFDDVTTAGVRDLAGNIPKHKVNVYGATTFLEANQGYWELGYAYTDPRREFADQSFHNVGVSFTRRYGGWLSNSVRLIHNFGQKLASGARQNANGTLLVIENSLVTSKPLTLVPYFNAFLGKDRPQSVARAADAGGILKNTGINFETDGLTGFPKLDDTANNTYGGALGVQYLFDLTQQVVVEVATVRPRGDAASRTLAGRQTALGMRYQKTLDKAWIFRADAIVANRENAKDIAGLRFELRRKF